METTATQIDNIKEMLTRLSDGALTEVRDFVTFLLEKERKRKAFEERVLKIEQKSDTMVFESAEEAMRAIRNWGE
jgi:hypothetical protein